MATPSLALYKPPLTLVLGGMTELPEQFVCGSCGETHNLGDMELGYSLPDEYFELSELDRFKRGKANSDFCLLDDRCFVRGVVPIPIEGRNSSYNWGVWAEVSQSDFQIIFDTWLEDDVTQLQPIEAVLANTIPEYKECSRAKLKLILKSDTRPLFYCIGAGRLAQEQEHGINITDLVRYAHQEWSDPS